MEIKHVYVKTRADFGKQCIFDLHGPKMDAEIQPNAVYMNNYTVRSHNHVNVQYTRQMAMHQVRSTSLHNLRWPSLGFGSVRFIESWINFMDKYNDTRQLEYHSRDDDWWFREEFIDVLKFKKPSNDLQFFLEKQRIFFSFQRKYHTILLCAYV